MSASSGAPTSPRLRSESTSWMLTKSDVRRSSSLETQAAPAAAAFSAVKFWLQATTSMPKAFA